MAEDTDDLFVIDKQGASESQSNSILYHFKPEEDPKDTPDPEPKPLRQRRGPTGKRYHETSDFTKYRPGKLSKELRKALDLAKHQIPIHVYRMRTLGYPPGWLRKARVGGELTIFDSATVLAENEEVVYNRDALVSYPGFNAELEYPYVDQSHQLNCPPMQSHHMLDNFYAALSRTSRLSYDGNGQQVPKDLEKLRLERERILAEIRLLDSKISQPADESGDTEPAPEDKDQLPLLNSSGDYQTQDTSNPPVGVNGNDEDSNSKTESSDSNSQFLIIGALEEGTPTPSRLYRNEDGEGDESIASGSSKRPSIDAFTVGVQPFRPFENLPGTEGAYQRVLKTLRRSRTTSSFEEPPQTPRQQLKPSGIVNTPTLDSGSQHLKSSTPHESQTPDRWSRESRSFNSASSFSSASRSSHFHSRHGYSRSERRYP